MRDQTLIQYITKGNKIADRPQLIHDKGNWGVQVGVLVGYIDYKDNNSEIYIGYSLKNKKEWTDKQFSTAKEKREAKAFDKNKAIELATEKAIKLSNIETKVIDFNWVFNNYNQIPRTVIKQLPLFIDRCERYFQGVPLSQFWNQVKVILDNEKC